MESGEAKDQGTAAVAVASGDQQQQESGMWAMDGGGADCDCPGPPPEFLLPPPPRPPFLQDVYCSEDPLPDLETCDALPVSSFYHLNMLKIISHYFIGKFIEFVIGVKK